MEPYFDLILESRRKRLSWGAIAQLLTAHGITTTKQAVHAFLKRRLKRRYPLGTAPAKPIAVHTRHKINRSAIKTPLPETPEFTENLLTQSDFTPDPLTRPLNKKSKWNQIT